MRGQQTPYIWGQFNGFYLSHVERAPDSSPFPQTFAVCRVYELSLAHVRWCIEGLLLMAAFMNGPNSGEMEMTYNFSYQYETNKMYVLSTALCQLKHMIPKRLAPFVTALRKHKHLTVESLRVLHTKFVQSSHM